MKTGVFTNGLIWFGAAVSIAEMEAGFSMGGNVAALVLGHLFGGCMLYGAGLVGATTGRCAMETTAATFGRPGMRFFAFLNLLQLVGWTAVMIAQGASAIAMIGNFPRLLPYLMLTTLIGVWIFVAFSDRFHLATLAVGLLAVLCVALTFRLARLPPSTTKALPVSSGFWPAFEVSIAMPLSWLPLISDYTSTAKRPYAATATSTIVYTLTSLWMYALGMLLAHIGAESVADGIVRAGLGVAGLFVVVFSTVTTTFLDAYSAGVSVKSILPRIPPRLAGVVVCAIGGVLAILGILDRYIDFLYFISSVFAPMAAVFLVDRYLVRRGFRVWNLLSWVAGFVTYHVATASPIGPTLSAIAVSSTLALGGWLPGSQRRGRR
ncbi:MAG: cytosine permease [Kiritimatiellia bacterium]|jgi:putative hydroxymethylpyrimidine transporter CytX